MDHGLVCCLYLESKMTRTTSITVDQSQWSGSADWWPTRPNQSNFMFCNIADFPDCSCQVVCYTDRKTLTHACTLTYTHTHTHTHAWTNKTTVWRTELCFSVKGVEFFFLVIFTQQWTVGLHSHWWLTNALTQKRKKYSLLLKQGTNNS